MPRVYTIWAISIRDVSALIFQPEGSISGASRPRGCTLAAEWRSGSRDRIVLLPRLIFAKFPCADDYIGEPWPSKAWSGCALLHCFLCLAKKVCVVSVHPSDAEVPVEAARLTRRLTSRNVLSVPDGSSAHTNDQQCQETTASSVGFSSGRYRFVCLFVLGGG